MMRIGLRVLIVIALGASSGGCHRTSAASPPVLDWHTSPLDLDLRGMNGQSYRFTCPAGKPAPASVTGSGIYTDASSICAAAAHAGAIDPRCGGIVMIQILPGQEAYLGTTQNFIRSDGSTLAWGGSFAVLPIAASAK